MNMSVDMYTSGVNVYKNNEFYTSTGILLPSLMGIQKNNSLIKEMVMDVSTEQLEQN